VLEVLLVLGGDLAEPGKQGKVFEEGMGDGVAGLGVAGWLAGGW